MINSLGPYHVALHQEVERFLQRHQELATKWPFIEKVISVSPTRGGKIVHLKAKWLCDYRWQQGRYRLLYEIIEDEHIVHVYEAGLRGDIYRKGKKRPYRSR